MLRRTKWWTCSFLSFLCVCDEIGRKMRESVRRGKRLKFGDRERGEIEEQVWLEQGTEESGKTETVVVILQKELPG